MAQRLREEEKFQPPISPPSNLGRKRQTAAAGRTALSVTPAIAPPLPVGSRSHFRRGLLSPLQARAAPGPFLTLDVPSGAPARHSFGLQEPSRGREALFRAVSRRASCTEVVKCAARSGAAWPKCFSSLKT